MRFPKIASSVKISRVAVSRGVSRCLALRQEPAVANRYGSRKRRLVGIRRGIDNVRQQQAVPQVSHIALHRVIDIVAALVVRDQLIDERDRIMRRANVLCDLLGRTRNRQR